MWLSAHPPAWLHGVLAIDAVIARVVGVATAGAVTSASLN